MTTPRYPTSAKYRRHQSQSKAGPVIKGLLLAGGVFLLFQLWGGGESQEQKSSSKTLAKVGLQHDEDLMPPPDRVEPEAEPQTMVSLTAAKQIVARPDPALVSPKKTSAAVKVTVPKHEPVKLSLESKITKLDLEKANKADLVRKTKATANAEANAKARAKTLEEAKKQLEHDEQAVYVSPPPPSGLAPKVRDLEVEITFYKEFSRRKVVIPKTDSDTLEYDATPANDLLEKPGVKISRPLPPPPGSSLLGIYQVQLVIFSSVERANLAVSELQKLKAPAYLVKAPGYKDTLYRVRLGPFSSEAEAKWAMDRWKIRGSSPIILRQRP